MKTYFILFMTLAGIFTSTAQRSELNFQKIISGSSYDGLTTIESTSDGGYILGGSTSSNIFDNRTPEKLVSEDLWFVKMDAAGKIAWQKTIGGNAVEELFSIKQTKDGGYIIAASSNSDISGNKTEDSKGESDYWILKLDALGDIVWQKTYGGDKQELFPSIIETTDGGYFVSGVSTTDINGDKTDPSNGSDDIWVLKLDSMGQISWQKSIGGSLEDNSTKAFQTIDQGFIIYGNSNSPISGNKTQPSQGHVDMWIVKLNADGKVQWDKTLGGSDYDSLTDMIQTKDGGYLLGGDSFSNISGDKTQNNRGIGDYWVLKLDVDRNIVWQKTIGGSDYEYLTKVAQLNDGSYLIGGTSLSNISGEKTVDTSGNLYLWVLQLDAFGTILNQSSLGVPGYDYILNISTHPNYGFTVGALSKSTISEGKTSNGNSKSDYMIFKGTTNNISTNSNTFRTKVSAYPNPASRELSIDLGAVYDRSEVVVTNFLGQPVATKTFLNAKILNMELQGPSGTYLAGVKNNEDKTATFKIVKSN